MQYNHVPKDYFFFFFFWGGGGQGGEILMEIKWPGSSDIDGQDQCEHMLNLVPRLLNFFPFSTQLSTKFILLINVKMPTIVGILTFISMINTTSERLTI